ncbi:MAG: hypothetical protein RIQ93_1638 [Verrucomicrobiota bacterium]|jgi:riboflavin kinase/FMN adenylyltransferase
METAQQFEGLERVLLPARDLHLAIGMFDGVHQGHRAVIDAAVASARADQGMAAVLTFWPHPSAIFRPENPTRLLFQGGTRMRVLNRLGLDAIITQPFSREFAEMEADRFVPWLKQRLPSLAGIYVGENFRYGRNRRGNVATLASAAAAQQVSVFCAPPVIVDGLPVSSTRIRELLTAGEVKKANVLLGYPYFAHGIVTPGKRLGRTLGFPTLNLPWTPPLRPRLGVYVTRISGERSSTPTPAVANYGLRPTVERTTEPRLEVHAIGTCPFGEGDEITVEWLHFLRAEAAFNTLDELRTQIARDRTAAQAYFNQPH